MWLFFIIIMLISNCAWSEELKNPFISPLDKIEYQKFLDKKKEEDRVLGIKKKEEESKKIKEELLRRQKERRSIDERRTKEQLETEDKKVGAPNATEEQNPNADIMRSIELQGIIFNENKKDSRVIIEGEIYAEGEIIADKILVISIQKDYVEFSYQGFKFKKEIILKLKDEPQNSSNEGRVSEPMERNRGYKKDKMRNSAGSANSKIIFKKME